jgi:hypothetical protein
MKMRETECYNCGAIIDKVGSYMSEVDEEVGSSDGYSGSQRSKGMGISLTPGGKPRFHFGTGTSSGRSFKRKYYKSKKVYRCVDCAREMKSHGGDSGKLVVDKSSRSKVVDQLTKDVDSSLSQSFNMNSVQENVMTLSQPVPRFIPHIERGILGTIRCQNSTTPLFEPCQVKAPESPPPPDPRVIVEGVRVAPNKKPTKEEMTQALIGLCVIVALIAGVVYIFI